MKYQLTQHARHVLEERGIPVEWLERVLEAPEARNPDPHDLDLEQRFGEIPEYGNRVLRVVVNVAAVPERVVSVFFDRNKRGRL